MSKNYKHFTQDIRDEISILLKKGYSHRDIAKAIGKNHSSVSREIRNNSASGIYEPRKAQRKARKKRLYSKYQGMKIKDTEGLEKYIGERMERRWTPEQIAGRLKRKHGETVISTKSIYGYLYSPYGQHLCKFLTYRQYNKRKGQTRKRSWNSGNIKNRVFIDDRPDIINERERFGDFEGDTLGTIKSDKESLVGAVERMSRYFLMVKMPRLRYAMDGFKNLLNPYQNITYSMTLDNGGENKRHYELGIDTYFCHPYSSWEKGQIENIFGRLRRFIPKKKSLKNYSPQQISDIMNMMNNTPRKCLGFRTPKEVFNEQLALPANQKCCTSG